MSGTSSGCRRDGQLIAEPASRLRRRAIGRRLDRQPNQLAGREVDRLPAIDYEPVGKHLHEHDGSARASPLGQSGETAAIRVGRAGSAQKLRIQFPADAAVSHCGRVTRSGARGDPRGPPRRTPDRLRCVDARSATTTGWLRARPADGDRVGSCGHPLRHSRRRDAGRPGGDADRKSRLAELAADDARRGDGAAGRDRGPTGAGRPARGQAMPIWLVA